MFVLALLNDVDVLVHPFGGLEKNKSTDSSLGHVTCL